MNINEKPPTEGNRQGVKMHSQAIGTQEHGSTPPQSSAKQRQRILKYLQQGNRLTTLYSRESLGIMHVAARVKELRELGWNIVTHWTTETDITSRKHRIAEYILMNG